MTTLLLFAFVGAAGLAWGFVVLQAWPRSDAHREGRPLRFLLWAAAISAVAFSVLQSMEMKSAEVAFASVAGVLFPSILLCGLFATNSIRGQATRPLVPVALLAFSAVITISAFLNGQIGQVTWLIAFGLLYLPGLTVAVWRTSATRESIRVTVRQICLSIVWMSLAYALVDLPHALGDLPRRWAVPGIAFRLAGVTPHPNGLAFTAAIAIFLTFRVKQRFWLVHVLACAAVLYLAEARTLSVGLAVALAGYYIVSAKKSRLVRMINTVVIGTPIAVFLWPTIASSFEETSLGSDVTTLNSRTTVWKLVADNWTENPVLGWGAFTFDNMTRSPLSALYFHNSHNQFLEALIEGGAVGLILMAGVALVLAWSVLTTRDAPYVAVAIMTLFFMMTEVPFTLHNYGFNYSVLLGALMLAILVPGPINHASPCGVVAKRSARQDATLARLENALASQRRAGTMPAASPGPIR
jgi:O-antigen ligase